MIATLLKRVNGLEQVAIYIKPRCCFDTQFLCYIQQCSIMNHLPILFPNDLRHNEKSRPPFEKISVVEEAYNLFPCKLITKIGQLFIPLKGF